MSEETGDVSGTLGASLVVDDDRRIVEADDSCAVVFERSVGDLVGRTLPALESSGYLSDGFVDRYEAAVVSLRSDTGGTRTFEADLRAGGEGEAHSYEATVRLRDGGGTDCTLRDVGVRYRYEETVEALNGTTRELMTADSKSEVFERVGTAAGDVLGFPGVGVRSYDPDAELLRHVAFGSVVGEIDSRPPYAVDDSPHGRAFRAGETVVEEIGDDDPYDREAFSHTMYVPIGEEGVLSLGRVGGPFDRADVHFAEILADDADAVLRQVEQRERLRAQRRRLRERNERLDEFASVVSHDLRNPLGVAKGGVEAYHKTGDGSHLGDVEYALDRMETILDDMLALAREGLSVDDLDRVSVAGTARAAWSNVETGDLSLHVDTERVIEADGDRLQRLFENLFRNAARHAGTATTVRVGDCEGGFFVADDGIGIPEDRRERVFEPDYTTAEDGTGLGLSIVEDIADAHEFSVAVTDGEDGGARFEVTGVDAPYGSE